MANNDQGSADFSRWIADAERRKQAGGQLIPEADQTQQQPGTSGNTGHIPYGAEGFDPMADDEYGPYGEPAYHDGPLASGAPTVLAVVGAIAFFVFSFFTWYQTRDSGCAGECLPFGTATAYDRGIAIVSVLIILAIGVAYALHAGDLLPVEIDSFELYSVVALLIADVFFLLSFLNLDNGHYDGQVERATGLWLAFGAAVVVNAGVIMAFIASGQYQALRGTLDSLRNSEESSTQYETEDSHAESERPRPHMYGYGDDSGASGPPHDPHRGPPPPPSATGSPI